ncbi:MAG: pyruvate dehydrogenase (acetyl-transferring), homodimeric type [Spirochaetales bacterium]|nr:pyruvate dehydrogenase (acetyl-transferring), homodimeric type [Spirochaetales bacterium]
MSDPLNKDQAAENREWVESLDFLYKQDGEQRVRDMLRILQTRAQEYGVVYYCPGNTPYINTIPVSQQPSYPGNREIERRIKSIIRWNAMAMVVRANRVKAGVGGHISTYASAATLLEVGFNHFFRGRTDTFPGDIVYFQGHGSPGIYSRAFLEGRITQKQLEHFRREISFKGGLTSYPHPWLMPDFWQFPTVSMGLGPIQAIYQARFNRYLEDRGLIKPTGQKVWAFLGDGEMDEPESMGAITLAARERLNNLIFVINCNLQRLDGPVRGNGQIIQELEAAFSGAGWNVIKVIWGSDWDPLFEKDSSIALISYLNQLRDGVAQKLAIAEGDYTRRTFFGQDPLLLDMVKNYSDEELNKLRRGGHDPEKVYAAYLRAVSEKNVPTVILAQTVKGYGLGEAGEGRNITHQQKKLNEEELIHFRNRFSIPISDKDVANAPFYKPDDNSEEMKYLRACREKLGGHLPQRYDTAMPLAMPADELFSEFYKGSGDREEATTMSYVRLLTKLLQSKEIGKNISLIVPDEARTFGMDALFRQVGIYSHVGQLYEPVDRESFLYYKEAKDGVILEEGITEAGSMASFIAAGTAYSTYGINMIPFFTYYSMFGFQRIGDFVWAAGDSRTKGFMVGATSGRTTLAGEGLQHQDGQSHLLALTVPNLMAYDPAFAYEIAAIIKDGIRRMFVEQENIFYYLSVMNEVYAQPPMPEGAEEGILKGLYRFKKSTLKKYKAKAHLLGSGAILNEALKAAEILEKQYHVSADVWSLTSYKSLYNDAIACERWDRLHPQETHKTPYLTECLDDEEGVFVAASDYVKALPCSLAAWIPGPFIALGTDGFGRSDGREELRDFFEVDARHITVATLHLLEHKGIIADKDAQTAINKFGINPEKQNPATT